MQKLATGWFTLAALLSAGTAASQVFEARQAPAVDPSYAVMLPAWRQADGLAKRIAIGEAEHPFVIGLDSNDDTQAFYMNDAGKFEPVGGRAKTIAAFTGSLGGGRMHFEVTSSGQLFEGGREMKADQSGACVREVASGQGIRGKRWDWALRCDPSPGAQDLPVARRVEGASHGGGGVTVGHQLDLGFHPFTGAAVRITAGLTDAVAWVVNSQGRIFRQNYCKGTDPDESVIESPFCKDIAPGWEEIPGCARTIANGGRNQVWIIGCDEDRSGNASIYQYAGPASGPIAGPRWTKRAGRAKEIAVDPFGRPWAVMANGTVWRWALDVPAKGQALESDPREGPPPADPR